MFRDLIEHRRIIWHKAVNDLARLYTASSLGLLWNVVNPLALIGMYTLVFGHLMVVRMPASGSDFGYVPYLCTGLLAWLAFSECVQKCTTVFIENASYLKRFNAPLIVYPAAVALNACIVLMIGWLIFVPIALCMGVRPHLTWLIIPVPLILCVWMAFTIGLALGMLNVFVRDLEHVVKVLLTALMWGAPIIYVRDILPPSIQPLVNWHPFTPVIEWIRSVFLHGVLPDITIVASLGAWCVLFGVAAWALNRWLQDEIKETL